jgi:hypothetical protein
MEGNKMSTWDNLMHGRNHGNGRSINRGIESILRTLDTGTIVTVITDGNLFFNGLHFSSYDPETNLAYFFAWDDDPANLSQVESIVLEASRIARIQKFGPSMDA